MICDSKQIHSVFTILFSTFLGLALTVPAWCAQDEKPDQITLAEVLKRSALTDQVREAQWNEKSVNQDREQVRKQILLPTVQVQTSLNARNKVVEMETPIGAFPMGEKSGFQLNASLYQPIYKPGVRGYILPALESKTKASHFKMEQSQLNSAREAGFAFFDLLIIQSRLLAAKSYITSLESRLEQAEHMIAEGRLLKSDGMKVKLALLQAKHGLLSLKEMENVQEKRLMRAADLNSPVTPEWRDNGSLPETTLLKNTLKAHADHRPDLEAIRTLGEALDLREKAVNSERLPELNALALYRHSEGESLDVSALWEARIQLTWKPFESGTRSVRKAKIQAEKERIRYSEQALKTGIDLQLDSGLAKLRIARHAIDVADQSRELAAETLRVEQARFKNQRTTVNDLLSAEADLFQQQAASAGERLNYWKSWFDTCITAGIIWDGTTTELIENGRSSSD